MRFLLLLAFSILSIGDFANGAEVCSTIPNVAPGLGDVHDQAGLDWCHSFTVADLLTQKLQKLGVLKAGERIHPLQIAALFHLRDKRSPNRSTRRMATTEEVLEAVKWMTARGAELCTMSDLDSLTTRKNPLFQKAASASLQVFSDAIHVPLPHPPEDDGKNACPADDRLQKLKREFSDVEQKVWLDELNQHCHVKLPPISWHSWYEERKFDGSSDEKRKLDAKANGNLEKSVDAALSKGQLVGIAYNPDFMVSQNYKGRGLHWSTIVARKMSAEGTCLYQIRNSWGKSCSTYSDPSMCSDGLIWVSKSELLKNMIATEVIN